MLVSTYGRMGINGYLVSHTYTTFSHISSTLSTEFEDLLIIFYKKK